MSDVVLRFVLKAAVLLVFIVLVLTWHFFRSRSPRAKKWLIGALLGLVLLTVAYGFARSILRKRYTPRGWEDVEDIVLLVDERREQIERVAEKLETLRELVSTERWLPDGELSCPQAEQTEEAVPLFWAFQLREAGHVEFGDPLSDLGELEVLISWARAPETILDTYREQSRDWLLGALEKADSSLAIVVELQVVDPPELDDVSFGSDGSVTGEFTPGRVEFRLAVVECGSGKVIAHGGGEATNSGTVRITADPDALLSDLRGQTRRAATKKGHDLMRRAQ